MSALGSLVVQLGLDYAQYQAGWSKAEQQGLQGAKRVQDTLDGVKSTATQFVVGIGAAIAGAFSVSAFKSLVEGVAASQTELKKLSEISGVSVEKLSGMAAIARYSGTQADQLSDSMNQLTQKMVETKKETDPAAEALKKIGINFKEFRDLTPDEQFLKLAKSLDKFEDGAGKSAAIMAIMGEEGAKLLPFMKDLATAGEIQAKVTAEQIAQSEEFQRSMMASQASTDALKTEFVNGLIPGLNLASRAYAQVINDTGGLREETRALASDGSLKDFAIVGVKALSYVIDAGQIVYRVLNGVMKDIWALVAAGQAVIERNWAGAKEILSSESNLSNVFDEQTFGAKLRDKIDELGVSSAAAAEAIAKPTLAVKDFVQAGDEGSKAADKMKQAYAGLMSSIEGKIAALKKEEEIGRQLTDSEKELVKLETDLRTGKFKLTDAMTASVKARIADWTQAEKHAAVLKLEKEGLEAAHQARVKYIADLETGAQSLIDGNKSLREEIELIGKNDAQRLGILRNRNLEIIAIKEAHAAELLRAADQTGTMSRELIALQAEIEALKERNGLLDGKFVAEGTAAAVEQTKSAYKSLYDNVSSSLTDALMTGGKNAKDYLMGMLRSLFVQPFVMNIMANVMGMAGGGVGNAALQAASGGLGGLGSLSGLANFLPGGSSLGGLFSNFSSGMAGGWVGFEGGISMMQGGEYLAGGMQALGAAAPYIGALIQLGKGNVGGAVGTAAGAYIGSIVPGIGTALGALVGSVFGNALSGLFGRKLKDSGIEGTFGGDTGFEGNSYKFYKGGWFRSNKTTREALSEDTRSAFADQYYAMDESIRTMAGTLGLGAAALDGFTYDFKVSLKGLSDEEAMAKLQEVFGNAANAMAELILTTDDYTRADESRLETLQRLSGSLQLVNGWLETAGQSLYAVGLAGADMASQLIDQFGDAQAFVSATGNFFSKFYSDAERLAALQTSVGKVFADNELGTIPQTREEFRALVGSLDLTTESGRKLYAMLLGLTDSLDTIYSAAEQIVSLKGDLDLELLKAQGRDAEAQALERARRLLELSAYGDDELIRKQKEVWAAQDARAADEAAREAERQANEEARARVLANLSAATSAQKTYWQGFVAQAKEAYSLASGYYQLVSDAARNLYGGMADTAGMQAARGMVFIEQELERVRRGGALASTDTMREAITAAQSGLVQGNYARLEDLDYDKKVLAAQLTELGVYAGKAKSDAELQIEIGNRQIEQLDDLLEYWQNYGRESVAATMTVEQAVRDALEYIRGKDAAAAGAASGPAAARGGGASLGGGGGYIINGGSSESMFEGYLPDGRPVYKDGSIGTAMDSTQRFLEQGKDPYSNNADYSGSGKVGWDEEKGLYVPRYASGTNFVPAAHLAILDPGEAVLPQPFNPWAGGKLPGVGDGANAEDMRAVRELLQELVAQGQASTPALQRLDRNIDGATAGGALPLGGVPARAV